MNIIRLITCIGLFVVFDSVVVLAQDTLDRQAIEAQLNAQKSEIEFIEPMIAEGNLEESRILEFRQTLRISRSELQKITAAIKPVHDDVKADLADLGPVPTASAEGDVASVEPENIQKEREALTDKSLVTEGLLKRAEVLSAKSNRLLEKVASLRRGQFLNQLFEAQASPFNAKLWPSAIEAYAAQLSIYRWPLQSKDTGQIAGVIFSCLFFLVLFFVSTNLSRKSLQAKLQNKTVDNVFSLVSSSLVIPLMASALGLFLMYQTLNAQDIINDANSLLAYKAFGLTAFLIFVYLGTKRFTKALIIRPSMRWLALLAVALYAVDTLFLESGKVMGMPLELAIAQSYIVTTIFAVLLGLCSYVIVKIPKGQTQYFFPRQIFIVLFGVSLFIIAANVFGYAALSRYLFERIILLFSLFAFVLVVRAIIRPYLCHIDKLLTESGETKDDSEQERLVFFWLSLTLDVVLFFVCLPVIAGMVGAEWQDIQDWAMQAFFGFKIGTMTISIANTGIAIFIFLVLLFVTRLAQRVLGQKILPKTKMDEAIRQSIIQVMGYVGLIVALMAAISAIGFDLTNLALIAGALSVGIGFGLQSIVSNFVSGLILLFERPIKVGDWVVTNSGEGIVKRIKVRATEIETFDRTSIIVPNSELISSSVKNWTHADKIGRVIIPVGVAYHSDPQQVHDILLKCAIDNEHSLKNPEPNIFFKDFADSALLFEMRFFIKNIRDVYKVSTTMRFEIWDAFKAAGIEISFPQRDLHIRSADGLKGLIDGKK